MLPWCRHLEIYSAAIMLNIKGGFQAGAAKKSSGLGSGHDKKVKGMKGRFVPANRSMPLNPNARLLNQCENLLKKLMSQDYAWVFNTPVDVIKLNIPDFSNVVKSPMDLGTVKGRLNSGECTSPFFIFLLMLDLLLPMRRPIIHLGVMSISWLIR